ncbi:MAG: proton-conducting transporter membrane subunit [Gammaproteobacteria bacterium]|nr:MAG: proton-conducting transporter membrane subunit [Gammaproteobacteria bacterium]
MPAHTADMTTPGGLLLVLAVLVPVLGLLAGLVVGGRQARSVVLLTIALGLAIALAVAREVLFRSNPLAYVLGGWAPPLGIILQADGLSAAMMLAAAVVVAGIAVYAGGNFGTARGEPESRRSLSFWLLLLAVWGGLNLVFVTRDLFTGYVALEMLTFAAVPLVCLDGSGETIRAALRYLLFALLGSMLYLLGVFLLYGTYGTVDMALLAARAGPGLTTMAAIALLTLGLLAKTALFPLHLWLPPAHSGAPPAASAILSGLVVKGSWFLVVRVWLDVFPGVVPVSAAQLLAACGAAAILAGNVVALRQQRLKLLVAYSTVAQIGYLFVMFPLAAGLAGLGLDAAPARSAGLLQAMSHALAKAAMFMAAGLIYKSVGHDRIAELAGCARAMPLTVLTFALAGIALMGLPPSGAYVAKKLFFDAAAASGQEWLEFVLNAGAFLTASYTILVLAHALRPVGGRLLLKAPPSRAGELSALVLALASLLLGFVATGMIPHASLSGAFTLAGLAAALVVLAVGAVVAAALGLQLPPVAGGSALAGLLGPLRRLTVAAGVLVVRVDGGLRHWPVASITLLVLVLGFAAAIVNGH